MYWSSTDFSGWFRLKGKSRKTFDIIISTNFFFFLHFGFGGFWWGLQPPWLPLPPVDAPLSVKLTAHLQLVPKLGMCGAVPPLSVYAFTVWTETTWPLPSTNQTTCRRRPSRSAIPACKTHCWAVARIPCNCDGNCAFSNGFPVLAEGLDVVIPRTSAPGGGGGGLVGSVSEVWTWCARTGLWISVPEILNA
jgi:hypothetical protein